MESSLLPALVFGALAGWTIRSVFTNPSIPIGDVLGASVTLLVGWWIQRALGRQAQLDRVPIDSIARLCERLEDLINQCLDSAEDAVPPKTALLQKLRLIANEITWLGSVVGALEVSATEHQQLQDDYLFFKALLTDGPTAEISAAADIGRRMRTFCLRIQWQVCRRVLDRPGDIGTLAG